MYLVRFFEDGATDFTKGETAAHDARSIARKVNELLADTITLLIARLHVNVAVLTLICIRNNSRNRNPRRPAQAHTVRTGFRRKLKGVYAEGITC